MKEFQPLMRPLISTLSLVIVIAISLSDVTAFLGGCCLLAKTKFSLSHLSQLSLSLSLSHSRQPLQGKSFIRRIATSSSSTFHSSSSSSSSSSSEDDENENEFDNEDSLTNSNKNNDDDDEEDDDDDITLSTSTSETSSNVVGTGLCPCCTNVRNTGIGTGFYRNGYCSTGEQDMGRHTVCVQVTDAFLEYSKNIAGNDLTTPMPHYLFPGLKHGDIWCLCAQRWVQAYNDGMAPKVYIQSTHERTLSYVPYHILRQYAIDQQEADTTVNELNRLRDQLNKLL